MNTFKTIKFKKGRHYSTPFPWPKFYTKTNCLSKTIVVNFTDSCRYNIGQDQSAVNKLFGFSYGLHHYNSDRIGWRYNPKLDCIDLVLYSYENGQRLSTKFLRSVKLNQTIEIECFISFDSLYRNVNITIVDKNNHNGIGWITLQASFKYAYPKYYWLGYTLGNYFGGNIKAPHEMTILEQF